MLCYRADDKSRQQWESGEFPMVCESCLGDNPYLRMQKQEVSNAGTVLESITVTYFLAITLIFFS